MENLRIKFNNKKSRKKFFQKLEEESKSQTFKELSKKLGIPFGRLKLWIGGQRSIPKNEFERWSKNYKINLNEFNYSVFNLNEILQEFSMKGVNAINKKYGIEGRKRIGHKGMRKLRKILATDKKIYKKWRKSVKEGLEERFGKEFYSKMGKLGGKISIGKLTAEQRKELSRRAFRKSFKFRLKFKGEKLRSKKEVEVAIILHGNKIKYEYEKEILGYFPDFYLRKFNLIVEVVGLEWQPHIERTREKIEKFINSNYKVAIYTYPNMTKYFEDMQIPILTQVEDLMKFFWDISGKSSAHPGHGA